MRASKRSFQLGDELASHAPHHGGPLPSITSNHPIVTSFLHSDSKDDAFQLHGYEDAIDPSALSGEDLMPDDEDSTQNLVVNSDNRPLIAIGEYNDGMQGPGEAEMMMGINQSAYIDPNFPIPPEHETQILQQLLEEWSWIRDRSSERETMEEWPPYHLQPLPTEFTNFESDPRMVNLCLIMNQIPQISDDAKNSLKFIPGSFSRPSSSVYFPRGVNEVAPTDFAPSLQASGSTFIY